MRSQFRTTCPRPASVPHSESGYSISFESGCRPLCCCEVKALTPVCLWCVYPSSRLGFSLLTLLIYVCVSFHPHLVVSLLRDQVYPSRFSVLSSNNVLSFCSFGLDELSCLILTLIYFCSLFPLFSFCLSSFSPWPGLMQLLLPRPSCLAALSPPSARLPLLYLLKSSFSVTFVFALILLCIFSSTLYLLLFLPSLIPPSHPPPTLPLLCPGAVSVNGEGDEHLHHMLCSRKLNDSGKSFLAGCSCESKQPLSYNYPELTTLLINHTTICRVFLSPPSCTSNLDPPTGFSSALPKGVILNNEQSAF